MTKYDIVTIGDASEDIFVKPHTFDIESSRRYASGKSVSFELGEKISLEHAFYDIGGSACNTAVSFNRLGYNTAIITAIGDDSPSEKILERLRIEGVDEAQVIKKHDVQTNFSIIFNLGDERTIFVCHGVSDYSVLKPKKNLKTKWFFVCPMGENTEEVEKDLISMASEKGTKIAWNPGSLQIEKGVSKYRALLKCVSILILNREEAIKFSNYPVRPRVEEIAKSLHALGPRIIIVTDGKEGAYAFDGVRSYRIEAMNRERVDATGAGDSFASAFVAKFLDSKDADFSDQYKISEALKAGIVNSTSVVRIIGAQGGLLPKSELEAQVAENPRMVVEIY
ncbi:MAG: carbohydrate kinase family protein [Patescibacteria group bacterium]|jgi:sugar/nucleoside kinase (ribokinase family)